MSFDMYYKRCWESLRPGSQPLARPVTFVKRIMKGDEIGLAVAVCT